MIDNQRRQVLRKFAWFGSSMAFFPATNVFGKMLESEVPRWDEEWDSIVVGSGYAGSAAVVSMMDCGIKNVLMIDKMPYFGGNSNFSAGDFAVAGSEIQKKEGIQDSPELHIADTMKSGQNLNDPELVRIMAYEGLETLKWLEVKGVKWLGVARSGGHSVSRNHAAGSGGYIILPLRDRMLEAGATVRTNVIMDEVIYNAKGSVIGIKVRENYEFKFDRDADEADNKTGKVKYYRAIGGVVIATGGWAADKKFRQKCNPTLRPDMLTTNHMGATGYTIQKLMLDNIKMIDMEYIQTMHVTSADENSFGFGYGFIYLAYNYGIMINPKTGKRFVNEIANRRICSDAILAMNEKGTNPPLIIMDAIATKETVGMAALQRAIEAKAVWQFETLDEIIDHFKVNKEPFLDQLKRYNDYVRSGIDPEFGRTFEKFRGKTLTVEQGPFFVARSGPKVHHCMGGIKTTTTCQVINNNGDIVNGLFAAGEVTGGRHGYNRLGSNAVNDCNTFGKIAGKAIADRYKEIVSKG